MGRKRKNGEGTVRLRKDGRWEGRVVIGYDDKGLPKTKNVLAKTKAECVEKLKFLKDAVIPTTAIKVRADMLFGEWMAFWYEASCKSAVRPNTRTGYENNIRLYIRPRLGGIPLNKLTANDLQQFINWMKKDGRSEYRESRGEGLSDNTIRHCYGLCRRALEKAVAEKLISQIRQRNVNSLRPDEWRCGYSAGRNCKKMLIQARAEGYYEVFLLELTTGLRVGELMALQWDDLNLNTGELLIQPPKNKASIRTVILPPAVVAALRMYKQTVSSRWIFPSPKKEDAPIAPSVVSHRLAKILKHAGCKKVRFHDLHHVFATNALEHGMDVKTLSTIIGHISSATTLNVYAHVTDGMQRQAAARIDRGIGKVEATKSAPLAEPKATMTDFQPTWKGRRRWGSGSLSQSKSGRWTGRCAIAWPDGKLETRSVHADTEEECERLLAAMIADMRSEVAAEKERLRTEDKAS